MPHLYLPSIAVFYSVVRTPKYTCDSVNYHPFHCSWSCNPITSTDAIAALHLTSFSLLSDGWTNWVPALLIAQDWLASTGIVDEDNSRLFVANMGNGSLSPSPGPQTRSRTRSPRRQNSPIGSPKNRSKGHLACETQSEEEMQSSRALGGRGCRPEPQVGVCCGNANPRNVRIQAWPQPWKERKAET